MLASNEKLIVAGSLAKGNASPKSNSSVTFENRSSCFLMRELINHKMILNWTNHLLQESPSVNSIKLAKEEQILCPNILVQHNDMHYIMTLTI